MKYQFVSCFLLAFAVALIGCNDKSDSNTVLFTVNGATVTEEDTAKEVDLRFTLYQNQRPIKPENVEKARNGLRTSILKTKVSELLLKEASEGTKVNPEIVKNAKERYFKTFHGKLADQGEFEAYLKDKGVYNEYEGKIGRETQISEYIEGKYRQELMISEDTVANTIREMHKGNQIAEATNAVIYATATNVWRKAAVGEDFVALARRYSNTLEQEPDGDLGDRCDFNDFRGEDIAVWNAVSALKAGEVTPPLSTSEGLAIYKCYERTDEEGYAGGVRYHLGRIIFHRALKYENFSEKYVRRELEREAYNKVVGMELEPRLKTVDVAFPNGEKGLPRGFIKYVEKIIGKGVKK